MLPFKYICGVPQTQHLQDTSVFSYAEPHRFYFQQSEVGGQANSQCQNDGNPAAEQAGKTLTAYRIPILRAHIERSLPPITPEKCAQWYNYRLRYTPACLNEEDILM